MGRGVLISALSMVLAACAQISVQHLTPDGTAASGAPGLRYYLPKPYLLVTLLPPSSTSTTTGSVQQHVQTPAAIPPNPPPPPPPAAGLNQPPSQPGAPGAPPPPPVAGLNQPPGTVAAPPTKHVHAAAGAAPSGGKTTPGTTTTPGAQTSSAPSTDTSFQANNDQYTVKLIYLPDLSNPMTINITAGLFGTASFQPTLQDGWMLTSLQGSSDNSQAVQLAESLITAAAGTGSKAATGGATTKGGGGPTGAAALVAAGLPPNTVLSPGLYAFNYDHASGRLIGVCAVTYF
jgi:hypothetical protein